MTHITLILGAGASCHYGFPTGAELVDDIVRYGEELKDLKRKYNEKQQNSEFGGNIYDQNIFNRFHEYEKFVNRVKDVRPSNIDFFLQKNQDVAEAGANFIGRYILLKQAGIHLDSNQTIFEDLGLKKEKTKPDNSKWYKYLYTLIMKDVHKAEDINAVLQKIQIITFNYDVSLEYYLINALYKTSIFHSTENKQILTNFLKTFLTENIKHVYGQVIDFNFVINNFSLLEQRFDLYKYSYVTLDHTDKVLLNVYEYANSVFEKIRNMVIGKSSMQFHRENPLMTIKENDILWHHYFLFGNYSYGEIGLFPEIYTFKSIQTMQYKKAEKKKEIYSPIINSSSNDPSKIYILGFGFDDLNMEALGLDKKLNVENLNRCKVFFTNYKDSNIINRKLNNLIKREYNFWEMNGIIKSTRNVYDALTYDFALE